MHSSRGCAVAGLCQTGPCKVMKLLMSWSSDSLKKLSLLSLSSEQTAVELLLLLVDDELSPSFELSTGNSGRMQSW